MRTSKIGGLTIDIDRGLAKVTMNYPPFNPLGVAMLGDLAVVAPMLAADDDVRVVLLQSGIPGVFCLHGDAPMVSDMIRGGADAIRTGMNAAHETLRLFGTMPKVTIAKIAGLCRGGGHELSLALDMRFAATGITRMGQPEVAMGLLAGGGGTTRLTHFLGRAKAMEILLGCPDMTAEEGERGGWINKALPPDKIDQYVDDLAYHIADFPGYAIAATKKVINANKPPLDFTAEVDGFVEALMHPDAIKYIDATISVGLQQSLEAELDIVGICDKGRQIVRQNRR
jgi:enoyl-CoA hydratase/carnithine racemase